MQLEQLLFTPESIMVKKPHAETSLAKFISKRVLELRPKKSQAQIAVETGFVNANVLAMIKSGVTCSPELSSV